MAFQRIFSRRNAFLVSKTLNLVAITANSFVLVYVLVRILSFDLYPAAVLISSIGTYIMATDLGYSGFVYYRTRQSFLKDAKPHGSEAEVFILYMAVALIAAALVSAGIAVFLPVSPLMRTALSLYFLSIVLALPWNLLRRITAAVDLYLSFEVYEAVRRLFFLGVAICMLAGLPFIAFTLICLCAWLISFVVAIRILSNKREMALINSSPKAIIRHFKENSENIWQSGSLTITEFAIYNFPYVAIPFLFSDKTFIIAFDIFYKIIRFGGVSYAVPAESYLPTQTRAFYAHDRINVLHYYRIVMLLGLLPLGMATLALFGVGDQLFTALLSRTGLVDLSMRISMAIMLSAMLLKESSGIFLFGTGNYKRLSPLAFITLGLMAFLVAATWLLQLSFHSFMYAYVAIYCLHATIYTVYLHHFLSAAQQEQRRLA